MYIYIYIHNLPLVKLGVGNYFLYIQDTK